MKLLIYFAAIPLMAQTVVLNEGTVVNAAPVPIGTNIAGSGYYGPGQMFRNLLYIINPGLQGWQESQIVPMKAAGSPSTGRATGYFYYDDVTANYWNGGTYLFVASATNSSVLGCTGTITANTVADGSSNGPVYTLGTPCASAPTLDDYMEVRLVTPVAPSCVTAWACTGTVGGESSDLPTTNLTGGAFTGQQALSMSSGSTIKSYVDASIAGISHDWLVFQAGQTFQFQLQAKALSGSPVITVTIQRQGSSGGVNQSFTFTPGASWAVQQHSFSGNESTGTFYNTCQIGISVSGGTAEIVNLDLERTSNLNAANTTVFRDEVVAALQAMAPGSLRDMDVQFGQTVQNWTTDQWGGMASQYNMQQTYAATGRNTSAQTTVQLIDFLHLCEFLSVHNCWITIPPSWTTTEYGDLMDFLFGGSGTTYGAKRIALGHTAPYSSTIPVINLEFANEPWNQALWGETMPPLSGSPNTMTSFGKWSNTAMAAMKARGYSTSSFNLVINQQSSASATYSTYAQVVGPLNSNFDTVALAPYIAGTFTSCSTNATCYNPSKGFAWGDTNDASSTTANGWTHAFVTVNQGGGASCSNCLGKAVAIYEDSTGQENANSYLYPQFNVDQLSAVTVTQQMLEHLKIIGSSPQNIFTLTQQNASGVNIWGTLWEAGGEFAGTGNYIARPILLSTQIANGCVGLGTYYTASISGNVLFTSTTSNGTQGETNAPSLFAYPFMNGNNRCLVLVNTDFSSHTITLTGNNVPTSASQVILTPTNGVDSNNETGGSPQVSNVSGTLTITGGSVTLPPYSIQSLSWSVLSGTQVSGLACSPTSLGQSEASTCALTLNQAAPTGGLSVTLSSNNASLTVPASVTVTAGATTATFSATAGASIASNQSATVTATLGNSQTATLSLLAPVLVSTVACSPTSLGQSAVSTCTVTLTQVAPTGGSSVTLASNNALLTVPVSVTVTAGATTATFNATASASIASNQSATVTAALSTSSKTATISLLAPVLVSTVACSPASLGQSAVSTCTVTLTQVAPTGGSSVTLSSNNALLTVPASVIVSAGATTATFNTTASASIASNQSATVTATLSSSSQTATISLLAPVLVSTVACSPTSLGQSAVSTCTVTLTQVAPTGGSSVTLSGNNALLTVPASVTVTAGATTATFNATASASIASNQSATVTATLNSNSHTATISLLVPVLVSTVSCSPTSLGQSAVSTCTVTLTQVAPTGGSSVAISSNSALLTVPSSVTVTAGATTATFSADASANIASNQSATVTASLGSSSQTANISLLTGLAVSGVTCNSTSLGQSAVSTCTVTLTETAPAGGSSVTLSSNNALLTVPASVTVTAGATTATFSANAAVSIASNQSAIVTATLGSSQTATISLLAPVLVSTLACSPTSLGQTAASTCTVTLTQVAPTGGSSVSLSSNNALLTVPASATVTAGATTATFIATASASIASNQSAIVTATLNSSTKTATISLLAPALVSALSCTPTTLAQSAASTCTVTLTQVAPTGGSSVTLSSNNASLNVPASVTVTAGNTTATFNATSAASITGNQSAGVTATLNSSSQTATISLVPQVLVSGVACNPTSIGQSAVSTCTVTLSQVAPTGGSTVTLSSNNASLTVPGSVAITAGATTATFSATAAASITSNKTITVTATLGSSSQTATVSVLAPVLIFTVACNPTSLGPSSTSACTVTLTGAAPTGGSSVALSSNSALLTVPSSVTVTAGATTATFSADASANIASNQSATVTASLGASSQTANISLLTGLAVSGVTCNPTSLGQSAVSTCTATLTQVAPPGGSSVTLSSNNALLTVPASATVTAGATTATFTATASASITSNQSAIVTAALNSSSKTATISLLAPALVSALSCTPTSLAQSAASTCTVTLTQVAPTGGSSVTLSSNSASLTVPASVTVTAGTTTATFNATAAASITGNQSAGVTATLNSSSQTATISLVPQVLLSGVACNPTSIGQSAVSTCTVTLSQVAPTGGSIVTLSSNNSSLTVPGSVAITAGATTAAFSATAAASITSNKTVTVTATLGSSSQTTISVLAPVLIFTVGCNPTSLGPSSTSACTVTLTGTAPTGGSSVALSSNNALLTVPSSVTVTAGATTGTFNATSASSIASSQSAAITATLGSSSGTATISLITSGSGGAGNGGGGGGGAPPAGSPLTVSPTPVTISAVAGGSPGTQVVTLSYPTFTQGAPTFLSSFSTNQGQGWLSLSPASGTMTQASLVGLLYTYTATVTISADPTGIAAGSAYTGTINFESNGGIVSVPISMDVTAQTPASLSVSPLTENLTLTQGASPATDQVTILNTGGGALQFTAQVASNQGNWLTLTGSGSGNATSSAPTSLGFVADPTGLAPGVYTGQINVQAANPTAQAVVNVTLAVSPTPQLLTPSQSGLTFSAVAGALTPPSQSFTISSQGSGSLSWTAQAQTISNTLAPSANWLSISPASGSSTGDQSGSPVEVSVDTTGLPAGQYYGSVNIDAPSATNNPQSVLVLLNVAPASGTGVNVGFSTGGVIFSGSAGNTTPQQQQISLFNPSGNTVNYSATTATSSGTGWLSVVPATGQLLPGSASISIGANLSALSSGVQTGTVTFAFDNGTVGVVQVAAVATAGTAGSGVSGETGAPRALTTSSACAGGKPRYLVPVFRQPVAQSVLQAAVPQTVQIKIIDDCSNPLSATNGGAVQVSFGDQDASIDLHDTGGGIWEGTWTPINTGAAVSLQAVAFEKSPGLSSITAGIAVTVRTASVNAQARISAVVNAAVSADAIPQVVTPGSYVAIYGTSLSSSGGSSATTIPLPTSLNGTQLFLGGQSVPLIYSGTGQVNALIPRNLNPNTSYQLVLKRGSTMSVPTSLTVAKYQPGIYTLNLSGSGQGIVEIAGTTLLAAPAGNGSRPAQRGSDYLAVFATGLGPVIGTNGEAPPADGAAASVTTVYQTTGNVTATIGGVNALVVFSGLTPSLVGLYQVNVLMPVGAPTGDAVPLVLTVTDPVTGQRVQSNSVTIAVQ